MTVSRTIRSVLKKIVPSALVGYANALRLARYRAKSPFAGVYDSWDSVPVVGKEFEDDAWADTAETYIRQAIEFNRGKLIPPVVINENALLPFLIALSDKPLDILDFGGATGFSYLHAKLGATKPVNRYVVVEHPKVCERGRAVFSDSNLVFTDKIPGTGTRFDVVLIGSALQCIRDYKALLRELAALSPRWFLFTKLPAGENVTFVTAQINLPGKRHPHWLFNHAEFVSDMEQLGYGLMFKGAMEQETNQDRFKPEYRVGRYCNLLFQKTVAEGRGT